MGRQYTVLTPGLLSSPYLSLMSADQAVRVMWCRQRAVKLHGLDSHCGIDHLVIHNHVLRRAFVRQISTPPLFLQECGAFIVFCNLDDSRIQQHKVIIQKQKGNTDRQWYSSLATGTVNHQCPQEVQTLPRCPMESCPKTLQEQSAE